MPIIGPVKKPKALTTPLYGGNVCHLYETPLPLYPASDYSLTVVIEQDPMKLFPIRNMIEDEGLLWSEYAKTPADLEPFAVQMRGVWNLALNAGDNSLYDNYYVDYPSAPNGTLWYGMQQGGTHDYWWAYRAFQPSVDVYINEKLKATITCPNTILGDGQPAVVTHDGSPWWPALDWPNEALYAYAPSSYPIWIKAADRLHGYHQWTGGGGDWDYTITLDGYCRMTITVTAKGRAIRLECSVLQSPAALPNTWGLNKSMEGSYYNTSHVKVAELANLPGMYNGPTIDHGGYYGGGGRPARPDYTAAVVCHEWTGGNDASTDSTSYDFDSMGTPQTAGVGLAYGCGSIKQHDYDAGPPVVDNTYWDFVVRSPLLIGLPKDPTLYLGPSGALLDILSMLVASSGGTLVEDEYNEYKRLRDLADARQSFNAVYLQPRIKISCDVSIDRVDGPDSAFSRYYYIDLPYMYDKDAGHFTWESFYPYLDSQYDDYTWPGGLNTTISQRESMDRFSQGSIEAGYVKFGIGLNEDGMSVAKLPESATLGDLYEGENDYIANNGQSFESGMP